MQAFRNFQLAEFVGGKRNEGSASGNLSFGSGTTDFVDFMTDSTESSEEDAEPGTSGSGRKKIAKKSPSVNNGEKPKKKKSRPPSWNEKSGNDIVAPTQIPEPNGATGVTGTVSPASSTSTTPKKATVSSVPSSVDKKRRPPSYSVSNVEKPKRLSDRVRLPCAFAAYRQVHPLTDVYKRVVLYYSCPKPAMSRRSQSR
jgi:hypothetical protein